MLDSFIRVLAHILTPLFLFGMSGAALLVLTKLGSDIVEFFEDDSEEDARDPAR